MIIRSIGMMTFINVMKGVVSLLLSFYMAKAVSPAEYGLIAFAIPLAALITLLTDLGIANAIVRERKLNMVQAGSALVMMLVFGIVGGIVLALLATPIQWGSGLTGVHDVVLGFSLVACFSVWATCPRALIERELRYNTISAVEFIALIVATVGFFIALHEGWGIFALVVFHISMQCVRSLIFLVCARTLFTWVLVPRGITSLIQTGGWIFVSNLLSYASRNLDRFIIAANLGAAAVGLYGLAYQFMTVPLVLLAWPASGVLLSTLSRLNDDDTNKKLVIEGFLVITAAAVFPMMSLIAFQSGYPLDLFLSEKWQGLDRYVSILAPLGAIQALAVYASAALISDGRMQLNFKLSLLNGALVPIGFILSASHGLFVTTIVYFIVNGAICALMIYHMCKTAKISGTRYLVLMQPGLSALVIVVIISFIPFGIILSSSAMQWAASIGISAIGVVGVLIFFRTNLMFHLGNLASLRVSKNADAN
jgi:O-antigen/teichoic acid export membrane protein